MNARRYLLVGMLAAGLSLGCSGESPESEPLGRIQQELNICNETVPEEHYVDGIPAYAQCDETTGAIYSNNGVDTSTTSLGSDWVRTQYSGGYQCTEYAYRYLFFRWDIDYRGGNGGEWCDGNLPDTLVANSTPVHGDLVVFTPGSCGADLVYGHIAVVDSVDESDSSVTFVEQNRANRRSCPIETANCFLHAVANDGQTGTGGAGGAGGAGGSAAGGGSGGSPIPSCSDGVQNQAETGIDCGGNICPACADGAPCVVATDCINGICSDGICGCPAGLSACAGACVDINSDSANCGACGQVCAPGTVCQLGVCSGSGGTGGATEPPGVGGSPSGGAPPVGSGGATVPVGVGGSPSGGAPPVGSGGATVPIGIGGAPSGGAAMLGSGGNTVMGTGGIDTNPGAGGIDANPGAGGTQSGGAAPTGGLSAGGGPDLTSQSSDEEESGCGCSVAGSKQRAASPLGLALAALLVLRRRRERNAR